MKMKPRDRQKRFADEYLVDLSASKAAVRAGYSARYGAKLLRKKHVRAYLSEQMAEREKRTQITQDSVIRALAAIGFADIADYVRVDGGGMVLEDTDRLPPEKRAAIAGIKKSSSGVEVKLADKLKALELLGRHVGLFEKKQEEEEKTVEWFKEETE